MARPKGVVVPAPIARAPRLGLVASARRPDQGGEGGDPAGARWETGIVYRPEGCVSGTVREECDTETEATPVERPDEVVWRPVALEILVACGTAADTILSDEDRALASRAMESVTDSMLGFELWTGEATVAENAEPEGDPDDANAFLADPVGEVLGDSGAGTDPEVALGCLEDYLGSKNGGSQGMIHATRGLVTAWQIAGALRREGNRLLTALETIVVPSPGYPGTSPSGAVATGNVWAYATDTVDVRLASPRVYGRAEMVAAGVDVIDNVGYVLVTRKVLASWERCRHAGIRVDATHCPAVAS